MEFDRFVEIFADQPVVESASVITLVGDEQAARVQISRWVEAGKLIQLRRGYYLLAPPYRRKEPNLHYIANLLSRPSYVSLAHALAYYGLIPEEVSVISSVTTGRPRAVSTPIGRFEYRHVSQKLFWGYETIDPLSIEPVQMATPEKALLDLIYLTDGDANKAFFEGMRIQHVETLNVQRLKEFARRFGGRKVPRAADVFEQYILELQEGMETL